MKPNKPRATAMRLGISTGRFSGWDCPTISLYHCGVGEAIGLWLGLIRIESRKPAKLEQVDQQRT